MGVSNTKLTKKKAANLFNVALKKHIGETLKFFFY